MTSRIHRGLIIVAMLALMSMFIVNAQQKPKSDNRNMSGMSDMSTDEMNKRGDRVMGFDHTKTTHHFRLLPDGGSIEVTANSPGDTASRDEIRMHLGHIAKMFAAGNFQAPMLVHDETPPGVLVMKRLKDEINYSFAETERGATVHISTRNGEALQAIYEFLRFQIKEHKTGDSLEISKS